jgi:DNA replication protein DnaC
MFEQEESEKATQHCPNCTSLDDCVLIIPGMVPVPEENEAHGQRAMWRYRKCPHLLKAESEKQQSAAINGRWRERTLETFRVDAQNKAAHQTAIEYAKRINPFITDGLLFSGSVGTGKTHLAAGILKKAFSKGLDGVLISVPDLLDEIRKGYNGEENTIESKVRNKFLVVLDDLGAENLTEWVRERLFMLINHRYEHQKPLIITTNCTPAELTVRIGERTTDRIREVCKIVQIGGKSRRGNNDKQ